MNDTDTLPKNLTAGYRKYGDSKVAMRQKDLGIWRSYTWQDSYEQVRNLGLGLISLGLERGDKVCIIGDNDPQYFWAQLAIQAGGGVAVGIFTDSAPAEIQYVVHHSDATFVFAKDQEQCDKLLEIRDQVPAVRRVIYWDDKGLWSYDEPWLLSFEVVHDAAGEQAFMRNVVVTYRRVRGAAAGTYYEGTVELPAGTQIDIEEDRSFEVADPNVELSGVLAYWISGFPGLGFSTQDIGLANFGYTWPTATAGWRATGRRFPNSVWGLRRRASGVADIGAGHGLAEGRLGQVGALAAEGED